MGVHKIHYKNIEKLFGFTRQTWAKWQQENRPIVKLINNYFDDEDINQLLTTDKIAKLENADKYSSVIQSLSNIIYNFDYFQINVLYSMCDQFVKNNTLDNVSIYSFQLYFTINGFSNIIKNTDYFPNENTKKEVLNLYKSNSKVFDVDEVKKMQAYFMFEEVCKLNDILIQILLFEYKTIIQIKKGEGRVLIPMD